MAAKTEPAKLSSTEDVADFFDVHVATVRRWAEAGMIPGYRVHARWRFDIDEVRAAVHKDGGKS